MARPTVRRAVVALGSNLGDRAANIAAGFSFLRGLHDGLPGEFLASRTFETEPVDCPPGSPGFLNAVASFLTALDPLDLLDQLLDFEHGSGRPARRDRNSPRTLDLDLLVLGDLTHHDDRLTLPHPRMMQRLFVLDPLADILPGLRPPGSSLTVEEARNQLSGIP